MLDKIGKKSKFIEGMRVTDEETMDVVEMVLVGKINKEIVSRINSNGGHAMGLSGTDGNLIRARKMWVSRKGKEGQEEGLDRPRKGGGSGVHQSRGDPHLHGQQVDSRSLLRWGWDPRGEAYNINADLVAGKGGLLAGGGEVHSSHRCGRSSGRSRSA